MAKAVAIFEGGIHERRMAAIREDGVVFRRYQVRDPRYGYRWSAWTATGEKLGANAIAGIDEMSAGFATLRRCRPDDCCINYRAHFNAKGEVRYRLP